jgi:hypothetical protein
MLEYQDKVVQDVAACTCDRCQRRLTPDDYEWWEKLSVSFHGGYGSIFGDGCKVEIDLCQQCVKETLGAWLRISPSTLDVPITALRGVVRKPDQPVSIEEMNPASGRLRGSVRRYDNPTDPVWPSEDESS